VEEAVPPAVCRAPRRIVSDVTQRNAERSAAAGIAGVSYRAIAGIAIAVLIVLFIVLNRDETDISFIVFTAETHLWIALTLAAAGGFVAGFLISRRRYRQ
jgi:uncharacterized integral membrane protein